MIFSDLCGQFLLNLAKLCLAKDDILLWKRGLILFHDMITTQKGYLFHINPNIVYILAKRRDYNHLQRFKRDHPILVFVLAQLGALSILAAVAIGIAVPLTRKYFIKT